jgi:hypothetical protein
MRVKCGESFPRCSGPEEGKDMNAFKRLPAILNTFPNAVPCKSGEWVINEQYITDHRGQAVVQWGSHTTRKNADLIVLAKRFEKELREMAAKGKKKGGT